LAQTTVYSAAISSLYANKIDVNRLCIDVHILHLGRVNKLPISVYHTLIVRRHWPNDQWPI